MKFIVSLLAIYAYFSFALINSLKDLSYSVQEVKTASIAPQKQTPEMLLAKTADKKQVSTL